MINIEIDAIENEKQSVIMFYKKQVEAFRAIKKEAEGALIIAVLHDTELAESISDHVICL